MVLNSSLQYIISLGKKSPSHGCRAGKGAACVDRPVDGGLIARIRSRLLRNCLETSVAVSLPVILRERSDRSIS